MKFGSKLESFLIREWADKYIRYKYLNRLLKSAYRFKNSTKPQEDEDLNLQTNIFCLDADEAKNNESDPQNLSNEEESSPKQSTIDNQEVHPESITVKILPYKQSDESNEYVQSDVKQPSQSKFGYKLRTSKSDEIPDVIRLVAETFEEKGHLNFEDIPQLRQSTHFFRKNLATHTNFPFKSISELDKLDLESGIFPKKDDSFQVYSLYPYLRDSEHSFLDIINPDNESLTNSQYDLKKNKLKDKLGKRANMRNMSMFRHIGPLRSELGSSKMNSMSMRYKKSGTPDSLACFDKCLRDDIRTVVLHYSSEMEYITILINYLRKDLLSKPRVKDESYSKLLQKAVTALWDSSDKLKSYLNTNILAVYKLLKKKDKLLDTDDLKTLYPTYKEVLLSVDCFMQTNQSILSLYKLISEPENVDFNKMKKEVESSLDSNSIPAYYLSYMLGLCTVLFLISVILCSTDFGRNYNLSVLLAHLPIFRVFFIFGIVWCGIGWCQNYLETYGVNYQFLFKLSNNYSVNDRDFYFFGVLQCFLCLLLFCIFILDCKLNIFGTHDLYYIYPILLIFSSIVVILLPKKNFKLKLRRKILFAVFRSFTSPICVGPPVSLADSILADVYTSLTRPFVDIVFIFSYFIHGVYYDTYHIDPPSNAWAIPLVMILPFFLRFMQCLRRFVDVGYRVIRYITEIMWLHFGNMLKYVSGMICVIVSSLKWSPNAGNEKHVVIITCYVVATLYNFLWDYFVDWGLSSPMNIFKRRGDRRMYNLNSYYVACLVNLLCRFTWALTVTPFKLMEDQDLSLNIVIFIISLVEIFRRIVWVTFRLETEHLLNSYKYRTALWVPKLYKCKSVIVKELTILNE